MFFTQEDYRKIEKWLLANSRKDTDFVGAATPLKGNETVVLVQDGKNVKTSVKDIVDQFFLLGVSDFLNITDKYGESYISINQAIQLIPAKARKEGQVITFLNTDGNWEIYQFIGKLNQWNNPTLWNNPFDWEKLIIDSILPDEEDLTKSPADENGNSYLSLKAREYNPEDFSGLGRIILRKNIMEVEDPIYGKVKKNYLYQDIFTQSNTVYEIRYDFDLNNQTITIPENCTLKYEGGSLNNGHIVYQNTKIQGIESLNNITTEGLFAVIDAAIDEEDLHNNNGVLKFADREYNPNAFSGLGKIILRKNIVNGKNILTQDMINKENTIYEIRYDFDLNGAEITIPEGCVLDFQGGSFSNGNIKYNNTIICGIVSIKCEQTGKFYTTENGKLRISMSYFGFEDNKDCSSLVPNFVNILKFYDNVQVDVDVINCYLGIVDLTGIWNVEFKSSMSGYGRTSESYTPNIIIDRIFTSLSYCVSFNGVNIKGNTSETAIDLIGNTRMFFVEKCAIFNANIGISVGTVTPATDNANVVIRDCILQNNNYGIVLNSGNGRVQCYSNFVVSNINNYVIRSGVNSLIGNTSDSSETSFLGDILISGGGISMVGHDSDVHKGYFINGTNSDSMPLPISIINARHYDSGMKLEETPFSISLTGRFSVSIIGGYFFNELKFSLGSNFKALVSNAHLLNGSINGDARIMTINNQDSLGDITNTIKRNKYSTFAFENINGFLGELSKGDSLSFLNKTQNGLQLLNNIYLDESGNKHKLVEGFPASIFSFQNIFEIFKYSDEEELLFRFGEYVTPYIMFKERRLFFGDHTAVTYADKGDVCIDSITEEIDFYIYDGEEWISQHTKEIGIDRPTNPYPGFNFFDTGLNKPIWWTGSTWVDATGTTV